MGSQHTIRSKVIRIAAAGALLAATSVQTACLAAIYVRVSGADATPRPEPAAAFAVRATPTAAAS